MKKSWLVAKGENANRGVYSVCLGSEQHPATAQDRFLISLCHDTQPQFPFGLLGAAFRLQLLLGNIITTPVSAGGLCSIAVHVLIRRLVVQPKADINFHYYLQCIKWSFWGLTVLWCEHKWNLWEDLKHVDLSLTGQTSYHSKAIFYLHKYIFLPLCCCFDSVVFNTLLNMAWVFPSRHPDICCLCFLDCGIYFESFFITQLVPHSALSFCDLFPHCTPKTTLLSAVADSQSLSFSCPFSFLWISTIHLVSFSGLEWAVNTEAVVCTHQEMP